ncbi:hypothetical protein FRB99_005427 [Tulasnella sp. 403]|nr:hypothetical protein FRB99_005427 [Tulasnella sp. 403]
MNALSRPRIPTEEKELLPLHRNTRNSSPSTTTTTTRHFISPPTSPKPPPRSPPQRQATTTAAQHYKRRETPHDAAIAQLNIRLGGKAGRESGASNGVLSPKPQHQHSPRSNSLPGPFPRDPEPIFDPYTGAYRGTLAPPLDRRTTADMNLDGQFNSESTHASARSDEDLPKPSPTAMRDMDRKRQISDAKARDAELWAALNNIRNISHDVARTHLAMEGFGGECFEDDKGRKAPLSRRGSFGRSKADQDGRSDSSSSVKKQQGPFAGRREAIDELVRKLEDLSVSLKHFHELTPSTTDFTPLTPKTIPTSRSEETERGRLGFGSFTPGSPRLYQSSTPFSNFDSRSYSPPSRYGSTPTSHRPHNYSYDAAGYRDYAHPRLTTPSTSPPLATPLNTPGGLALNPGFGRPGGAGGASPPVSPVSQPSAVNSRPTSLHHVTRTGTLPPILDERDDNHRRNWESPMSTQTSFKLYNS